MSFRVRVDAEKLREVERQLGALSNRAPNALSRSLNRAMTASAAELPRQIRNEYHVKSKDVKDTITRRSANPGHLAAAVMVKGKVLGLDHFKVSPKSINARRKKQLKIEIKKKNGLKQIMGAFVANASGIKVFKRVGKKRLPINRLFGPSVPQMADEADIVDNVNKRGREQFDKTLDYEVGRILRGVGR